jgi:hypothetical protein
MRKLLSLCIFSAVVVSGCGRAARFIDAKTTVILVNQSDRGQTVELHSAVMNVVPEAFGHLTGLEARAKFTGSYTLRAAQDISHGKYVIFHPEADLSRLQIAFTPADTGHERWSSSFVGYGSELAFRDRSGALWDVQR